MVEDKDIWESEENNKLMVEEKCEVMVEVGEGKEMVEKIFERRRMRIDGKGRRDMVGSDIVKEKKKNEGEIEVEDNEGSIENEEEIRRVMKIGRIVVKWIGMKGGKMKGMKVGVEIEKIRIFLREKIEGEVIGDEVMDLMSGRKDIEKIERIEVIVLEKRLIGKVISKSEWKGMGEEERRRGKVIGMKIRRKEELKVKIERKKWRRDEEILIDSIGDRGRKRKGIEDEGSEEEEEKVEEERVEIIMEEGVLEIGGEEMREGRKRGIEKWISIEEIGERVEGKKERGDKKDRVRGVGERSDGGNKKIEMEKIEVLKIEGIEGGMESGIIVLGLKRGREEGEDVLKWDEELREIREGNRRKEIENVEIEKVGEERIWGDGIEKNEMWEEIGLEKLEKMLVEEGNVNIFKSLMVKREEEEGWKILRKNIEDGRKVWERNVVEEREEELEEIEEEEIIEKNMSESEKEVGRGEELIEIEGEEEKDELRKKNGKRMEKNGRLRLDKEEEKEKKEKEIENGGVGIGEKEGVGIGEGEEVLLIGKEGLGKILKIKMMEDEGEGRKEEEIIEWMMEKIEEEVELEIEMILKIEIVMERKRVEEIVKDERMVDEEIKGKERIDILRVEEERIDEVENRRKIKKGGKEGEVMNKKERREIGDLRERIEEVGKKIGEILDVRIIEGEVVIEEEKVIKKKINGERKNGNEWKEVILGLSKDVIEILIEKKGKGFEEFKDVDLRKWVSN